MAKLGDRIRDLQAAGPLEGEGGFTIDRDRARDKLRAFQLAAPHEYVLLVVEAAILRGASAIAVEVDADDVRVSFDAVFGREDLEQLYPSIFADVVDRAIRGRQALALAINAAMAMGPAFVRLESSDGEDGVRAHFGGDGIERIDECEGLAPGTRLHVRDRFRLGILLEFVRNLGGATAEAKVLRERCRHASIPITLNREPIAHGLDDGSIPAPATIDERWIRGVVGFAAEIADPEVEVITNGVTTATVPLPGAPEGLKARIDAVDLRKDLSQRGLVQDAALEAALGAVRGAIVPALLRLASALRAGDPRVQAHGEARLTTWLLGQRSSSILRRLLGDPEFVVLRDLPIWRRTSGQRISTAELASAAEIPVTTVAHEGPVPGHWEWVIDAREPGHLDALRRIFGARIIDATQQLASHAESSRASTRFRARRHAVALPPAYYLADVSIDRPGVRGVVAIAGLGGERPAIDVLQRGCLLTSYSPDVPVAGLRAVIEADEITPSASYEAAVPDAALAHALVAVLEAVERLMWILAEGRRQSDRIGAYVRWAYAGEHVVEFILATGAGFSRRGLPELLAGEETAARLARGASAWPWRGDVIHPFARAPVLRDGRGREHSIAALQARLDRAGSIAFVRTDEPGEVVDPEVLPVDRAGERLLFTLFGRAGVRDASAEVARAAEEARFLATPIASLRPRGQLLCEVPIEAAGAYGLVGVLASPNLPERGRLRILKQGRLLEDREVAFGLPGIFAAVDGHALLRRDGRADEGEVRTILRAAGEAMPAVVEAALAVHESGSLADAALARRFLSRALLVAIGGPPRLRLFAGWAAARELGAWRQLVELDAEHGPAPVEQALRALLGRGEAPTIAAIQRALASRRRRPASAAAAVEAALRQELVSVTALLLDRITFPALGGARLSLAVLAAAQARGVEVDWVAEDMAEETCLSRPVLVLSSSEHDELTALFGGGLRDARPELLARRARLALARRPQVRALELTGVRFKVALADDPEGLVGEVGLGDRETAQIDLFHDRRPLLRVELALPLPLQAVVDGDLAVTPDLASLTPAAEAQVQRGLRRGLLLLLVRLAEAWPGLPLVTRERLEPHLLAAIVGARARGRRRGPELLSADELAAAATIPLFPTLAGLRCLADLDAAFKAEGRLLTVDEPFAPTDRLVVDRRAPAIDAAIRAIYARTADYAAIARVEAAARERRTAAAALPGLPADALASEAVASHGLRGLIWLAPGAAGIACGAEGRTVGVHRLDLLGIGGAIEGNAVLIDPDWSDMSLGPGPAKHLLHLAISLYRRVLGEHRAALGRGAPASPAARALLLEQALAIARGGRERVQRGRLGELYRELLEAPLLGVGGFVISIQVARAQRPAELHPLGLWGDEPPPPPAAAVIAEPAPRGPTSLRGGEAPRRPPPPPRPGTRAKGRRDDEVSRRAVDPPPSPEARLLAALVAELRILDTLAPRTFDAAHLGALRISDDPREVLAQEVDDAVILGRAHPIVAALLRAHAGDVAVDPIHVSALVSAAYSALNRLHESIADADEERFHDAHVRHVLAALASAPSRAS